MTKRIRDACERAYDRLIEFERDERRRQEFLPKAPHIGDHYLPEQHDDMMRKVAKAIAASAWHERTTPYTWAKPLPLELGECETFISNNCNPLRLLGYFARSLRWNGWAFETHPDFNTFSCGVTEWLLSPPELRMYKELLQMFPPKALPGLEHPLRWRPPR
jgi:hypothetical protein